MAKQNPKLTQRCRARYCFQQLFTSGLLSRTCFLSQLSDPVCSTQLIFFVKETGGGWQLESGQMTWASVESPVVRTVIIITIIILRTIMRVWEMKWRWIQASCYIAGALKMIEASWAAAVQVAWEASETQRPHCQRFSSGRETLTGTDMNLSSQLSKRQSSVLLSLDVVQTSRQKLVMCLRINGKHGSNVLSLECDIVGRGPLQKHDTWY